MDVLIAGIVFLALGLWAGYFFASKGLDAKVQAGIGKSQSEAALKAAQIEERLAARIQEIEKLSSSLENVEKNVSDLKRENTELSSKEAAASERAASLAEQLESAKKEIANVSAKLDVRIAEKEKLESEVSRLSTVVEKERKAAEEKIAILQDAEKKLSETFKAISQDALVKNSALFTEQAKQALSAILETAKGDINVSKSEIEKLVKPIQDSLTRFEKNTREIEEGRIKETTSLVTQIRGLEDARKVLETKTEELVNALKADPRKWGSWGEMQLRRVIEIAGMEKYCDFEEQVVFKQEGRRPDVIVRLPNSRCIVIDAKAALDAYTASFQAKDESERTELLKKHSLNIRAHISELSKRKYDEIAPGSLDFVVMFVPGESVLASALDAAPELLEHGANNRVLLATPVTLIGLLRAIAYGWREEEIARNARLISEQGKELYERLCKFLEHFAGIKRGLDSAVGSYNEAVGSLERRLLISGRKMKELDSGIKEELPEPSEIDLTTRSLKAPEISAPE